MKYAETKILYIEKYKGPIEHKNKTTLKFFSPLKFVRVFENWKIYVPMSQIFPLIMMLQPTGEAESCYFSSVVVG